MANTFTSGLYPPIVDTYMPAYIYNTEYCKVYVTLSPYTTITKNIPVHINIVNQKTNKSALIAQNTFGLQLNAQIQQEEDTGKYYVNIDTSKYNFVPYTFYKVQFRTCTSTIGSESAETYLKKAIYSEWSTACLIKFIYAPETTLSYFTNKILDNESYISGDIGTRFPDSMVFVSGKVTFENNTGSNAEYVKNYSIKFFDANNILLEDSGLLSPLSTGVDEINYVSKYNFQPDQIYEMTIDFVSSGLYEWTEKYNFVVDKAQDIELDFNTQTEIDEENGRFKFNINPIIDQNNPFYGKEVVFYIRRTDSKTNYKYWEDVFSQKTTLETGYTFGWTDITIESGIWYKYVIQYSIDGKIRGDVPLSNNYIKISPSQIDNPAELGYYIYNTKNNQYILTIDTIVQPNTTYFKLNDKIINIFENSYITGQDGQQLKLKYDTTLDSYSYHQNIQKTETLGSKYPFIRQNGIMKYRSFTLSGLITYIADLEFENSGYNNNYQTSNGSVFFHNPNELIEFGQKDDNNGLFIKKETLYGNKEILNDYEDYFITNDISDFNNYTQERLYREQVINFLLDPNVKLFRSATEGNILIKLTDVSFSPKAELGRYLYSFSATATECADATVDNFNLYKIQALSNSGYKLIKQDYSPVLIDTTTTSSAKGITVSISDAQKDENIKALIEEDYKEMSGEYNLYQINFHSLGFSFLSNPYMINISTLVPEVGDDLQHQLGYLVNLDNQTIFVSAEDRFKEFRGDDTLSVKSISFPIETSVNVLMDADLIYTKTEVSPDSSINQIISYINSTINTYSMKEVNGYNEGIFNYNIDIIQPLTDYEKSLYNQEDNATFILNPYNIQITDVPTGSIFQIEDDTGNFMYIIGQTGNLNINLDNNLSDDRTVINKAYFKGTIAVWNDNNIISDTIITMSETRSGYGLWYLDDKWIWHEEYKDYNVKFFKNLQMTDEVSIISNIELDNTKFTYLQILKPVVVTGDIRVDAKLTTSLKLN